ncbi:MAG: hypothetical protein U0359_39330 [Byssovorax sp.]
MARQPSEVDFLPRWTKHVVADPTGRDPLGLSRVAQMLTDWLLGGITSTTNRARYYAMYAWILWSIQEDEQPTTESAFIDAFQRREAAVALATLLADEEASPAGKRAVSARLAKAGEDARIDVQFRVLPSNRLGGYGQYYSSCMYQLGLTQRPEGGFDQVSPAGQELAEAVHENIAVTPYVKQRAFLEPGVNRNMLERSAERLSVLAVRKPFARRERDLLTDMFFGLGDDDQNMSEATRFRRHTLALLLDGVAAHARAGAPITEKQVDEKVLFASAYYRALVMPDGTTKPATCDPILRECRNYWRQFCLHQYLTQALEGMLAAVLDLVVNTPRGLARPEIARALVAEDFHSFLETMIGRRASTPAALLGALGVASRPDVDAGKRARRSYPWGHPLSEQALCGIDASSPAERLACSCLLLGVLYAKWRAPPVDRSYRVVIEHAGRELTVASVLPLLDAWLDESTTWTSTMDNLIERLLLSQHDRVMFEKSRLESCWLHAEEGRIIYDQDCEPYFRTTRCVSAMEILVDLGLVSSEDDGTFQVTKAGHGVLEKVLGGAT